MYKKLVWFIMASLMLALAGLAQAEEAGAGSGMAAVETTAALSGTVLDVNVTPLQGAIITVVKSGFPSLIRRDTTDAAGRWFVGKLMAGKYTLKAEKIDYLVQYYDHSTTLQGAKAITLANQDTLQGLQFNLQPGAAIAGTVYLADGITALRGADISLASTRSARELFEQKKVKSDVNGEYRFTGLASGGYLVSASSPGYATEYYQEAAARSAADTVVVIAPEARSGVDFTLATSSAITGLITSEINGAALANATVIVYKKPAAGTKRLVVAAQLRSDASGRYIGNLIPGSYLVTASATGYGAEWYENVNSSTLATTVTVTAGLHTQVNMALKPWGGLAGLITDAFSTAPISGAAVRVYNEEKSSSQRRFYQTVSREDGTYQFAGLPAGRYIVDSDASGYLREYWQEADSLHKATIVTMVNGVNVTGIDFTLSTGGAISGLVQEAVTRIPLANALIEVNSADGSRQAKTLSDAFGSWLVTGLAAGDYSVSARALDYAPQWYDSVATAAEAAPVAVVLNDTTAGIDFDLTALPLLPPSISGLVTDDSTGLPLANALVLAIEAGGNGGYRKVVTSSDGSYVVRGLEDGEYIVLIAASGYTGEFYDNVSSWREARVIQIIDGQEVTGINAGLAPQPIGAYQVNGRVVNGSGQPVGGALVTLASDDQAVASTVTAEDGSFLITALPADQYALSASAAGYGTAAASAQPLALGSKINVSGLNLLVTGSISGVADAGELPVRFELEQNYPNPFNPSTRISYSLARAGLVRLSVFDLLGREVRELVQGRMAAGHHSINWDATDGAGNKLASGVYIYRLQVESGGESFVKMERMLLVK